MTVHHRVVLLTLVAAGCGASLRQVPADQPHGVLNVRTVHKSDRDFAYETQVALDGRPAATLPRDGAVRLGPGKHTVELISTARRYGFASVPVDVAPECVGSTCSSTLRRQELRTTLVEVERKVCRQTLEVAVQDRLALAAVLKVAADNSCSACVNQAAGASCR